MVSTSLNIKWLYTSESKMDSKLTIVNGIARMLKKLRTSKGTTVSSNNSLQVRPFSKWELLSKERICSQREQILSFKSSSLRYE